MFQRKTAVFKGAAATLFALLSLIPSAPCLAHSNLLPALIAAPFTTEQCVAGNVSICGMVVPAPTIAFGASATLAVPSPYAHQPFTVQCTAAGYSILDASAVTCAPLSCPASGIAMCGAQVAVPGGTFIGNRIKVPVPVGMLADPSSAPGDMSFMAQCVDDGQGNAVYQVSGTPNFSCNIFPCADSHVRLCETSIPIAGGAPLGGVMQFFMPPPFRPDPFTVGCIGTEGNPPVYQLTDVSAVTCQTMSAPAPAAMPPGAPAADAAPIVQPMPTVTAPTQ